MKNINPGYKGLSIFLLSLSLSFQYNYYINAVVFSCCLVILLFSNIKIIKLIKYFTPVFLVALGVFFSGYIYVDKDTAFQLSFRTLAFTSLGLVFVLTTKPQLFIISLMQQFKLPRNFAYGILAAYNFIPCIKKEYQNTKYAYRARGVTGNFYMLPLFVNGIKAAENISLAMESKGFSHTALRSQYLEVNITILDKFILMVSVIFSVLLVVL